MSTTPSWRRFLALRAAQKRVVYRALALLPLAAAGIGLLGVQRTRSLLAWLSPPFPEASDSPRAEEVARLVAAAARHGPYRATCLPTALVLQSILSRLGTATCLRLGVRRNAGGLEAHAWVEYGGDPLIDADVRERFSPFAPIDGRNG